jgi:integrase
MARATERLTALKVERAKAPGMYADGGGLYLRVTPEGTRNWVLRYMLDRRPRWMGLGPLALYGLAEARARALDARRKRHEGIDPIDTRRAERARQRFDAAKAVSFQQCAEAYVNAHRAGWRNKKHAGQWSATLSTYAYPVIGALPVQAVDTVLVLKVLEPIWTAKPETASRVRGRIESVLDFAKVRGYRDGENPARWRGHLDKLLPKRSKVRKVRHHPALPYAELPAFMAELRAQEGISARALEFTILTAARTNETIGARCREVDLQTKIWVLSAERMKAERGHRVPLSSPAIVLVRRTEQAGDEEHLFANDKGVGLSNMAMLEVVRGMNERRAKDSKPKWIDPTQGKEVVPHGFRSTFRDWAAERTNFPSEVVEMALAHVVEDETEAAYRRGDLFDKRRRLMGAWAEFLSKAPADTAQGRFAAQSLISSARRRIG